MKYEVENKELSILIQRVEIPEYQRDFVWNGQKQENLIRSLILEYPIGVLTAYKTVGNTYTVLDGLQRITTIKSFQKKPSNVVKFDKLVGDTILNIDFSTTSNVKTQQTKIKTYLKKWYEKIIDLDSLENDTYEFIEGLEDSIEKKEFAIDLSKVNIKKVREIYKNIMRNIKFLDIKVPLIVCVEFREDELTDVFEKMNTGSMKLSKYEVFVAQWDKYGKINFDRDLSLKIDTVIKQRNEILTADEDYEFSEECELPTKRYLYEYILTLSDLLQNNHFALKNGNQLGYEVLSLLLTNNVYGVNKLVNTYFVENGHYKNSLETFLIKIYNSIESSIIQISAELNAEEYKFAKYFKLITFMRTNFEIDLEQLTIEVPTPMTDEEVKELMEYPHDFANQRQTTYLHNLILECLGLNEKEVVALYMITHAGNPHPEDMIRIQVRPIKLEMELEEKKYTGIFGEYKNSTGNLFIEFNVEEIVKSNAKNKSVYVNQNYIEDFYKNNLEETDIVDDKYVSKIMTSRYFNKNYLPYN